MTRNPKPVDDKPFLMPIDDIFTIKGRGVIVTGRVQQGSVRIGDEIEFGHPGEILQRATISGLHVFHRKPDDPIGVLLADIQPDQIELGMVMAAPGSLCTS